MGVAQAASLPRLRQFPWTFVSIGALLAVATVAVARVAGQQPWTNGSAAYAWFGIFAVVSLWWVSSVVTGELNPFALAMGEDRRLSTSKMQALLWTATVAFVYAVVYADRTISLHQSPLVADFPPNVLVAMGISVTTAVAAKAITSNQAAANPNSKQAAPATSYDLSALVSNDDSSAPSLTKVQLLFWTGIAIIVYIVTTFASLGTMCTQGDATCKFPDIDTALMVFMGLGHASYVGGKLASLAQPVLAGASSQIDASRSGVRVVTLSGSNLGASGTIKMNGADQANLAHLTWSATSIVFDIPQKPGGGTWATDDTAVFSVTVGDAGSAWATLTIT